MSDTTPSQPAAPAPVAAAAAPEYSTALSAADLAIARETFVAANPHAVPELIGGSTLGELKASVAGATAAYQRIANAAQAGVTAAPVVAAPASAAAPAIPATSAASNVAAPVVPGGGAPAVVVDPATLSPGLKIRMGIEARKAAAGRGSAA